MPEQLSLLPKQKPILIDCEGSNQKAIPLPNKIKFPQVKNGKTIGLCPRCNKIQLVFMPSQVLYTHKRKIEINNE